MELHVTNPDLIAAFNKGYERDCLPDEQIVEAGHAGPYRYFKVYNKPLIVACQYIKGNRKQVAAFSYNPGSTLSEASLQRQKAIQRAVECLAELDARPVVTTLPPDASIHFRSELAFYNKLKFKHEHGTYYVNMDKDSIRVHLLHRQTGFGQLLFAGYYNCFDCSGVYWTQTDAMHKAYEVLQHFRAQPVWMFKYDSNGTENWLTYQGNMDQVVYMAQDFCRGMDFSYAYLVSGGTRLDLNLEKEPTFVPVVYNIRKAGGAGSVPSGNHGYELFPLDRTVLDALLKNARGYKKPDTNYLARAATSRGTFYIRNGIKNDLGMGAMHVVFAPKGKGTIGRSLATFEYSGTNPVTGEKQYKSDALSLAAKHAAWAATCPLWRIERYKDGSKRPYSKLYILGTPGQASFKAWQELSSNEYALIYMEGKDKGIVPTCKVVPELAPPVAPASIRVEVQ